MDINNSGGMGRGSALGQTNKEVPPASGNTNTFDYRNVSRRSASLSPYVSSPPSAHLSRDASPKPAKSRKAKKPTCASSLQVWGDALQKAEKKHVGKSQKLSSTEFRQQVKEVCIRLNNVILPEIEDPYQRCIAAGKEYQKLLAQCELDSGEAKYLRQQFQGGFVQELTGVIASVKEAMRNFRGVEVIGPLMQVLNHADILRNWDASPHPVYEEFSALIRDLAKSELDYLAFRECYSEKCGLALRFKRLYMICDPQRSFCHHYLIKGVVANQIKEQIRACESRIKGEKCSLPQDDFTNAIESRNIQEASEWVSRNPDKKLQRAMVGDILREKLDSITVRMKQLKNVHDKITLLETLSVFAQHYHNVIGLFPSIKKSLQILCSSLARQIMGEVVSGTVMLKQHTRKCIEQLEEKKFINCEAIKGIDLETGKSPGIPRTCSGLSDVEVNKKIDDIFAYLPKPPEKRDVGRAAELFLELIGEEQEICALPSGRAFDRRLKNLKTILFTECFKPVIGRVEKLSKEAARKSAMEKYKHICWGMRGFAGECIWNQRLICILRDEQVHKWQMTACKAWGWGFDADSIGSIRQQDLEHALELRKVAPDIPCGHTKNRLIEVVTKWMILAQSTSDMSQELRDKLQELISWCAKLEARTEHQKQLLRHFEVVRGNLERKGWQPGKHSGSEKCDDALKLVSHKQASQKQGIVQPPSSQLFSSSSKHAEGRDLSWAAPPVTIQAYSGGNTTPPAFVTPDGHLDSYLGDKTFLLPVSYEAPEWGTPEAYPAAFPEVVLCPPPQPQLPSLVTTAEYGGERLPDERERIWEISLYIPKASRFPSDPVRKDFVWPGKDWGGYYRTLGWLSADSTL